MAVVACGVRRTLPGLSYTVVWPEVLGRRPIRIVLVRDPEGQFRDTPLFTTDRNAERAWVVATYAARWAIAVTLRSRQPVMGIEAPPHGCQASIEKLAPWVWLRQTGVIFWHLTVGHQLPEAEAARQPMGPWDSEYSLRHRLKVLRAATWEATIKAHSASKADARQLFNLLKNGWNLAA